MYYPDRHHPIFFLQDALKKLGVEAEYNKRDGRTEGCWGLIVHDRPVVWLIDNRWMHERAVEDPAAQRLITRGALVMCAQKPDAERIGARWLPLAVTPGYEPPHPLHASKEFDVGFVGYVRDAERQEVLTYVSRYFKACCQENVFGERAVAIYQKARIGLNVPTRIGTPLAYDSANMRCFEVLATGTPLLTKYEPYLAELGLVNGTTCYTYDTAREVGDRVRELLLSRALINGVGANGAQLALTKHTYEQRAKQVLEWLS